MSSPVTRHESPVSNSPPRRFSPELRRLVEAALAPPARASVFTGDEITEVYECGREQGRCEAAWEAEWEAPGRRASLGMAVAWFLAGAITWGLIGFACGYLVAR